MTDFESLISEYFDRSISDKGFAKLCHLLETDPEHLCIFVNYSTLNAGIIDWNDRRADKAFLSSLISSNESDHNAWIDRISSIEDSFQEEIVDLTDELKRQRIASRMAAKSHQDAEPPSSRTTTIVIPKAVVWLGLAAMLAIVLWVGFLDSNRSSEVAQTAGEVTEPSPGISTPKLFYVATVRSSIGAEWSGWGPVNHRHMEMSEPYSLTEGLAEIVLEDGAEVIVQAPAAFELVGPNSMKLLSGRIAVTVPESAIGFEVETPDLLLTDLGTEFGIRADSQLGTVSDVFAGSVTVAPRLEAGRIGQAALLQADQAGIVRAGTDRIQSLKAEPAAYVRADEFALLELSEPTPAQRWRAYLYELDRSHGLIGQVSFDAAGVAVVPGQVAAGFEAQIAGGTVMPGGDRRKAAGFLEIDHQSEGVDIFLDSLPRLDQLTLVAWVRMKQAPGQQIAALMHRKRPDLLDTTPDWQIRYDRHTLVIDQESGLTEDQEAGRNEVSLPFAWQDRWCCIVAVLNTRSRTVDHYLDGRHLGSSELLVPGQLALDGLRLGGSNETLEARHLNGGLGIFVCLGKALSTDEVKALYQSSLGLFE